MVTWLEMKIDALFGLHNISLKSTRIRYQLTWTPNFAPEIVMSDTIGWFWLNQHSRRRKSMENMQMRFLAMDQIAKATLSPWTTIRTQRNTQNHNFFRGKSVFIHVTYYDDTV